MGWGPIPENAEPNKAWYLPAKTRLRCAHCGVVVEVRGKNLLFFLGVLCLFLGWVSNNKLDGMLYHVPVTGGLALLGVA